MVAFDVGEIIKNGGTTLRLLGENLSHSKEVGGDYWYFPLLLDRTLLVVESQLSAELEKFVLKNSAELLKRGRYLGVWFNPKDERYYLDINVRDKTEVGALKTVTDINKSSSRKILAIYNPTKDKILSIGGAQMR
ncbi:hypothetical protein EOL73_03055 [Candidatus Saccharibacteria bacterium]|nr:hypothetical protein [Candidatus Saccharibacteria bacterium]NCU40708.1 hypothetical protein [Candidatus Saccharibacteria bacterium]